MVGQDAQPRAQGKIGHHPRRARAQRHDAMLLIGAGHDEIRQHPPFGIADQPIALIDRLRRSAPSRDSAIQPASIITQPLAF